MHRFLTRATAATPGFLSVKDFLVDGAIHGVVARALLATLAVPSMEEFSENVAALLARAAVVRAQC